MRLRASGGRCPSSDCSRLLLSRSIGRHLAGVGCIYSYDPVGNYERVRVNVTGSGESLIQPLLDNQFERQHQQSAPKPPPLSVDLSLEDTVDLVKVCAAVGARALPGCCSILIARYRCRLQDAFTSAGERDIRTGDVCEIAVITKDGVKIENFPLSVD